MTPTSIDSAPLVSPAAIARASRAVIANAMAGDFPIDPVIGPDLSKSFSMGLSSSLFNRLFDIGCGTWIRKRLYSRYVEVSKAWNMRSASLRCKIGSTS